MKTEKCILIGPSGSGKDFLMRKLVEKGLKPGIKCTTRPPRLREFQGVTYNFVSEEVFISSIENSDFLCYQIFEVTPKDSDKKTWYYGFTHEEFRNSQVFIMTPGEFQKLTPEQRKGCFVVYLDIPRDIRESRLFKRHDTNDSITRRLDADHIDFKSFNDYDLRITDPDFNADDIWDLME